MENQSHFGVSVAAEGAYTVVGAHYESAAGSFSGAVKIFDSTTGGLRFVLINPRPRYSSFGYSVAISGSLVVVGAYGGVDAYGVAYVYDLSSATPTVPLYTMENPDPQGDDRFGVSVSISGLRVAIGAYGDSGGSGCAFVYDLGGATPTAPMATLPNPTPFPSDQYGFSVAISGTRVVVGASGDDTRGNAAGAAYVFDLESATPSEPVLTLYDPSPVLHSMFGYSLALSGTRLVVGSNSGAFGSTNWGGSVYVFDLGSATPTAPVFTLRHPSPTSSSGFGTSLALDGDRVLVGAPYATEGVGMRAGVALVFDLAAASPTLPTHVLANPDPGDWDSFGSSIAISGNRVVVGAEQDGTLSSNAGNAYVFELGEDSRPPLVATLNQPGSSIGDNFGSGVAISGSLLVSSAPNVHSTTYSSGYNAGSIHLYDLNGTTPLVPIATIPHPNPGSANGFFGSRLAVSGSRMVVGAGNATKNGSAYIYDLSSTPSLVLTLYGTYPNEWQNFGDAVAISGSTVVVGAPYDPTGAQRAGLARVFDIDGANPTDPIATFTNPNPAPHDQFGSIVAVSGSLVVVGAPFDDGGGIDSGTVYVYNIADETPAVPVLTLVNPSPAGEDNFGKSVTISGSLLVISAPRDDTAAANAGIAYVYDLAGASPTTPIFTLNNPSPVADDSFGRSLSIAGNRLVVGVPGNEFASRSAGRAYVYDLDGATPTVPVVTYHDPHATYNDQFGSAVSTDGVSVAIGAPRDSTVAAHKGFAYVFGPQFSPVAGQAVDDAVIATKGETTVYPLANDTGTVPTGGIVAVSNPAIGISPDGRHLIIPEGFTGSFTYTVNGGTISGTVTVLAGAPVASAKKWEGLLYGDDGFPAGFMQAASIAGRFTGVIRLGTDSFIVRFKIPAGGSANVSTPAGQLTVSLGAGLRMNVTLGALAGSLREARGSGVAQQHNIALAAIDAAIPGGGTARAFERANGRVVFVGKLPDGRVVASAPHLLDNGSFVVFDLVSKTRPKGILIGEFIGADLAATDVTGELAWQMPSQTSGLHTSGVDTILTANGCVFTPGDALPNGPGVLTLSGGDLSAESATPVAISAGKPAKTPLVPIWIAHGQKGTFSAKVRYPGRPKTVNAAGIYLPKSNSAWGWFPGQTIGGRIVLTGSQGQ